MTQFTTSKGEFIAVIQKGSTDISWLQQLPKGDYEFIGLSSDILKDEELAKKIVQVHEIASCNLYEDYECRGQKIRTPEGSVMTLFKVHNITGNQLIIKKK